MSSKRRLGAWGFEGNDYPAPAPLLSILHERLGEGTGIPRAELSRFAASRRRLPELPGDHSDDLFDRIFHSRGQGLTDLIRLRTAALPALTDAVFRPTKEAEVEALLEACAAAGVRAIPFGGGTSVTGGVNVRAGGEPVVSVDLERLSGLVELDESSGLATFGAGTTGPELESALASHGLTLGHFPQSFECSTLGGWIATRASGQESLGYASIEGLVAGLDLVAPAGKLSLPALPASAAGPDLRQLVLGSEGRLGIVTRATVRARPRPSSVVLKGFLLPSWEEGLESSRRLLREELHLDLLRLSDASETEFALALSLRKDRPLGRIARRLLGLRGATESSCMMLCGARGDSLEVDRVLEETAALLASHGGIGLGVSPGKRWLADRFRHPYLRDSLLDFGYATDTLETAAPWSRLAELSARVRSSIETGLAGSDERTIILCHVSHPYLDGASLYFTFFYRSPVDPDEATARWATLKRAATTAILDGGGALSHHHGVGSWHAPWYEREIGSDGVKIVEAAAAALDPTGILNPHVLLDPVDRLEE